MTREQLQSVWKVLKLNEVQNKKHPDTIPHVREEIEFIEI